jgi:antitoxin component HigA of HigAB toxin-antitoxin module
MEIREIRTELEYDKAVKEAKKLMELSPKNGTPEDDQLEILMMAINKYEGDPLWDCKENESNIL